MKNYCCMENLGLFLVTELPDLPSYFIFFNNIDLAFEKRESRT